MRIPRVYVSTPLVAGEKLVLEATTSAHLCRVLRMGEGRPIRLFNGDGREFESHILNPDPRRTLVEIDAEVSVLVESPLNLHLGLGLSRGDRFDWALQKATELGVTSITPLLTLRSDKWSKERAEKKMGHWSRLLQSACEQSGRTLLPVLGEPLALSSWVTQLVPSASRFTLDPTAASWADLDRNQRPSSVVLAIGPEGGFDDQEREFLLSAQFDARSIGPRVLRTETAPLAAISLCQYLWGDLAG